MLIFTFYARTFNLIEFSFDKRFLVQDEIRNVFFAKEFKFEKCDKNRDTSFDIKLPVYNVHWSEHFLASISILCILMQTLLNNFSIYVVIFNLIESHTS